MVWDVLGYVVAGLLFVVVIVGLLLGLRQRNQFRAALAEWADQRGWVFTAAEPALAKRWPAFPINGVGSASLVTRGDVPEGEITCFRLTTTSAGRSGATTLNIAVLTTTSRVPTVVVNSTSAFDRAANLPVAVDLGHADFPWSLSAPSEEQARMAQRLFGADVRDRMLREHAAYLPAQYMKLGLDGTHMIVAFPTSPGAVTEPREHQIALLRDMARMMRLV